MSSRVPLAVAAAALAACSGASGDAAPKRASACGVARLVLVSPRLQGMPDSGVVAIYSDKLHQVSYDAIPGLQSSRAGDRVRLCLLSRPRNCPPGDARGAKYGATNLRTGKTWTAADSSHRCGGA